MVETARLTGRRIELDPDEVARIDAVLQGLCRGDAVTVEYFVPDERKAGGCYRTVQGAVKKLDPLGGALMLDDGLVIAFGDMLRIEKEDQLFR